MKPILLHAANPGPFTGEGNWTYLIDGDVPVLIDAGVGNDSHLDAIDAAAGDRPLHLVVTHAHSDHISGAPAIVQRRPSTRLSKMPWPERDRELPWQPLHDGDVIATAQGELQVIHTPGHAPDHVCLWHAASRTVFVGDMLVHGTTVMIPASHRGSLAEYLQSLERLLSLEAVRALPAHGPAIDDPAALIRHYIEHRAQREEQVRAALQSGATTIDELLARIYPGLQPALEPMARESLLAHLIKLEGEGGAERRESGWAPGPPSRGSGATGYT
jgi:glyoxylase-like metal-dependent hydrolase (beta-lactamase superfamily II)